MPIAPKILIVDHNSESAVLLKRTLLRKFPEGKVSMCGDAVTALAALSDDFSAVIIHRTFEESAAELVKAVRRQQPIVAILVVSGLDRSEEVLAAGADGFLSYEEWLIIGTVLERVVAVKRQATKSPFGSKAPFGSKSPFGAKSSSEAKGNTSRVEFPTRLA